MIESNEIYNNYHIEKYHKLLTIQNSAINRISRFDYIRERKNIMIQKAKNDLEECKEYQRS